MSDRPPSPPSGREVAAEELHARRKRAISANARRSRLAVMFIVVDPLPRHGSSQRPNRRFRTSSPTRAPATHVRRGPGSAVRQLADRHPWGPGVGEILSLYACDKYTNLVRDPRRSPIRTVVEVGDDLPASPPRLGPVAASATSKAVAPNGVPNGRGRHGSKPGDQYRDRDAQAAGRDPRRQSPLPRLTTEPTT
jgi:hypothetical protein